MAQGYTEAELVTNRSSLLLSGGGEADRRAWAEEAAKHFPGEGDVVELSSPEDLPAALERPRGVLFIPDAAQLPPDAQMRIVHCLRTQEERPKIILGLSSSPAEALANGELRADLHYRLQTARVDLSTPGLRDVLRARRAARAKEEAKRPPPPSGSPRVTIHSGKNLPKAAKPTKRR